MRIALFSYHFPGVHPRRNPGVERVCEGLARHLSHRHRVTVYTSRPWGGGKGGTAEGYRVVSLPEPLPPGLNRLGNLGQLAHSWWLCRSLDDELGEQEILHDVGSQVPFFAPAGAPVVSTFHHWETPRGLAGWAMKFPLSRGLSKEHWADAVVAVSEASRKQLRDTLGIPEGRLYTIPNGYDPALLHPHGPAADLGGEALLYVGPLVRRKGLRVLLEAMVWVLRRRPLLKLYLVGEGPEAPILRDLAQRMHLTHSLILLGAVPDGELVRIYRGASALVLPSLLEGFGMTPLEALACGTPAVVSRLPSLASNLGGAAVYCDAGSPVSLARGILELLGSESLRKAILEEGRRLLPQYTWDIVASKYGALYEGLLRRGDA